MVAEAEEDVGAGIIVGAEVAVEVPEVAVAETTEAASLDIKVPNIQIYPQESGQGAICTLSGGGGVTSVPSPRPVRGKMSSLPSLKNETGTSPMLKSPQLTLSC